jgi:uncharacterized repeat protein (TIGR01451 family)
VSAPAFRTQKISTDLSGDPNVLLAGETLRYTITVQNVGTDNATTPFCATRFCQHRLRGRQARVLNGVAVADSRWPVASREWAVDQFAGRGSRRCHPCERERNADKRSHDYVRRDHRRHRHRRHGDLEPGASSAVSWATSRISRPTIRATPLATIRRATSWATCHCFMPEKRVVLSGDQGSPGIVDPGDVLRVHDHDPELRGYRRDGHRIDRCRARQHDLRRGLHRAEWSPVWTAGRRCVATRRRYHYREVGCRRTAVVQFDLRVNPGTAAGTVISNQAVASSVELPNLLTDGDGNPATGPEPTEVVVGDIQRLTITKEVAVVGGGPAIAGAQLEYTVRAVNIASVPASNVVITDNLDASQPGQLSYVVGSATLNGSRRGCNVRRVDVDGDLLGG